MVASTFFFGRNETTGYLVRLQHMPIVVATAVTPPPLAFPPSQPNRT